MADISSLITPDNVEYQLKDEISRFETIIIGEKISKHLPYINYKYDTPYYRPEDPSGTYATAIGIYRYKEIVILNRTVIPSGNSYIRISNGINVKGSNAQVDTWTTGITLTGGHEYVASVKLISGTSVYDDTIGNRVPACGVYQTGAHSNVGTISFGATESTNTFTAAEDVAYNFAIYIPNGKYTLTNATFLVTVEDISI